MDNRVPKTNAALGSEQNFCSNFFSSKNVSLFSFVLDPIFFDA